ncbi:MAG: DNA translocase FtsK 4TM domain-containing protein [Propylenella sp.]
MAYGTLSDDFRPIETRLRDFAARHALRLCGLAVIALTAALLASLVTWHVDDPSFSYVTDGPVRNILGWPGAAFADLAMQFLGFAVVGLLFPLAILGWNLFRLRLPRRAIRQSLAWLGGVIMLATALSCLPVMAQWPLPTGLGGAVGDLTLGVAEWAGGGTLAAGIYAALFVVLAGLSLGLLLTACLRRPAAVAKDRGAARRAARASRDDDAEEGDIGEDDETEDRPDSRMRIFLGIAAHWALTANAAARRLARRIAGAQRRRFAADTLRREPMFGSGDGDFGEADEFDDAFAEELAEELPPKPARATVQPAAPRPKPSARAKKEAQHSLLPREEFELPPLNLLFEPPPQKRQKTIDSNALEQNARLLEGVLDDFGVRGEIINIRPGPVVTLYELEPAPGIKSSRVIGLADDIARSMSAISARVAVIPGKNAIGIELPNANRETVFLRELLASTDYDKSKAKLALSLGKTIGGEPVIADLAKMPHLLVAGTTGSGKSVSINTMILSLLYRLTPDQCRLIMIDPKMLELSVYDGIPHLLAPVVTDPRKAIVALKWAVREMEDRYKKMSKLGVRNIDGFNQRIALAAKKREVLTRTVQTGFDHETGEPIFETEELELEPMPFIVVLIDEMADLMMVAGKDIEGAVQRLAQMARAAGIHVIMATQRPSVDVITGTIKANFPTRISFQVTSKIDSRTILGEQGAEQLLGQGDMLYMAGGGRIQRVHGPFVSDEEVEDIVSHLKSQGVPDYLDSITDEDDEEGGGFDAFSSGLEESNDLYDQAVAVVLRDRKASTSYIQRRLSIGYNRAASLIERMEKEGVVSPANHAGKREILVGENAA